MLFHLGYVSTQNRPFSAAEMAELLGRARTFNESHEITGVLLHREDSFFQVIEGEEAEVRRVFDRIEHDPRHKRIKVLFEAELEAREFNDWQMAFVELDGINVTSLPGFSDFLLDDAEPRRLLEDLTHAKRLMLLFRAIH